MIESHKCWNRARWVSINLFQFVCLHTEVCISHTKAHTKKKKPVHITLEKLHFKYDISSVIFSLSLFFSLTLSFPYSIALSELIRMNISLYFHIQKTRMETGHDFLFKYLNNMGFLSLMIRFEFDDPLKNTGDSVKFFIRSMENSWYIFSFFYYLSLWWIECKM